MRDPWTKARAVTLIDLASDTKSKPTAAMRAAMAAAEVGDERANEEHKELLDVWLARDVDKLKALTRDHIQKTLDDLRQQLGRD